MIQNYGYFCGEIFKSDILSTLSQNKNEAFFLRTLSHDNTFTTLISVVWTYKKIVEVVVDKTRQKQTNYTFFLNFFEK